MPYQLEGVGWMINAEKSHVRGGVLADEMGMGKIFRQYPSYWPHETSEKTVIKRTVQESRSNLQSESDSSSCCIKKERRL